MSLQVISLITIPYCRSTSRMSLRNTLTHNRLFEMAKARITTAIIPPMEKQTLINPKTKFLKKNNQNQELFPRAMMKTKYLISLSRKLLPICSLTNQRTKISWMNNSSILYWMTLISCIHQEAASRRSSISKSERVYPNALIYYQFLEYSEGEEYKKAEKHNSQTKNKYFYGQKKLFIISGINAKWASLFAYHHSYYHYYLYLSTIWG